jgi:hypothetical protein
MNRSRTTQLAFPLGAFLGQNMALVRLTAFETAIAGASETLGRAAVGFDFWHLFAPTLTIKIPEKITQQGKMHGPEELCASYDFKMLAAPSRSCGRIRKS